MSLVFLFGSLKNRFKQKQKQHNRGSSPSSRATHIPPSAATRWAGVAQPCMCYRIPSTDVAIGEQTWHQTLRFPQGSEKHKHKGRFSGIAVRRFTGGPRPQGQLPRHISDGFGLFVRRSGILGTFLYVPFICVSCWRLLHVFVWHNNVKHLNRR